MKVAICILAKDEERTIANILRSVAAQVKSLPEAATKVIFVIANGCTDKTAATARAFGEELRSQNIDLVVQDLIEGGKSRSWNRAVHEFVPKDFEYFFFIDSDVHLLNDEIFSSMFSAFSVSSHLCVISGHPAKDILAKDRKSIADIFSLTVSRRGRFPNAINGSLYLAKAKSLRSIWLPDDTPGEDGFLNAMVTTSGFSSPVDMSAVLTMPQPTHLFRAHNARQFIAHERRMIIATTINSWIFEHLWSLSLTNPAGPLIAEWNKQRPLWVEEIIRDRVSGRRWVIPNEIMFSRLRRLGDGGFLHRIAYLPFAIAATLMTIPPAIISNRRLKRVGAAKTW